MENMYSLWVYFSYKGSPYGFKLGFVNINDENFIIIKKRPQKLIEDFFEASEVKTAYGKFPNTEEFIYLTKKINGTTNKGEKLYLNFAFQVDNRDKFLKIYNFIETNRENGKLFDVFSKIVHIEEVSEFGYTINTEELKSILSDIEKTDIKKEIENKLYIESESIEEKLVNRLELEKQKLGIVKSNTVADYEIDTIKSISQKKNNENLVDSNSNIGDNWSFYVDDKIIDSSVGNQVKDKKDSSENKTKNVFCNSSFKVLRNEFLEKPANKIISYLKQDPVVQEGINGFINLIGKISK